MTAEQRSTIEQAEHDARDEYPVNVGDVWAIGPHRFLCGDAEQGAVDQVIDMAGEIRAVFTDPPWSGGQATMYRSIARSDGRWGRKVDFVNLLDCMSQGWQACERGNVWIVYGRMNHKTFGQARLAFVEAAGPRARMVTSLAVTNSKPACELLLLRYDDETPPDLPEVKGSNLALLPWQALATEPPNATVVDYCFGLGGTAVAADGLGLRFVGCELSPGRMAMTLRRVTRATQGPYTPQRVRG